MAASHLLVDDDDTMRLSGILRGEISASEQRNTQGLEKITHHEGMSYVGFRGPSPSLKFLMRTPVNRYLTGKTGVTEGKGNRPGRGFNAWHGPDAFEHLLVEVC